MEGCSVCCWQTSSCTMTTFERRSRFYLASRQSDRRTKAKKKHDLIALTWSRRIYWFRVKYHANNWYHLYTDVIWKQLRLSTQQGHCESWTTFPWRYVKCMLMFNAHQHLDCNSVVEWSCRNRNPWDFALTFWCLRAAVEHICGSLGYTWSHHRRRGCFRFDRQLAARWLFERMRCVVSRKRSMSSEMGSLSFLRMGVGERESCSDFVWERQRLNEPWWSLTLLVTF